MMWTPTIIWRSPNRTCWPSISTGMRARQRAKRGLCSKVPQISSCPAPPHRHATPAAPLEHHASSARLHPTTTAAIPSEYALFDVPHGGRRAQPRSLFGRDARRAQEARREEERREASGGGRSRGGTGESGAGGRWEAGQGEAGSRWRCQENEIAGLGSFGVRKKDTHVRARTSRPNREPNRGAEPGAGESTGEETYAGGSGRDGPHRSTTLCRRGCRAQPWPFRAAR